MEAPIRHLNKFQAIPGRHHRWLASFLHPAEMDALLRQQPIRIVGDRPLSDVLKQAGEHQLRLSSYVHEAVRPLPAALEDAARAVRKRDVFKREYQAKASIGFGIVPLLSLITPQPFADMDYVAQLASTVPTDVGGTADFNFAFPVGHVPEPAVIGNTVVFSTHGPSLYANPIPTYRRVEGGYEVIALVEARPNYLYVAELAATGGRLLLVNGVHHVLALLRAGRTTAPAVITQVAGIEQLGLAQTTLFARIGDARPPLVRDFLEPVAVAVVRRDTAIATNVALQAGQLIFPADSLMSPLLPEVD